MVENGYITKQEGQKAQAEPLAINPRMVNGAQTYAANYFTEEVRREIAERRVWLGRVHVVGELGDRGQRLPVLPGRRAAARA